MDRQNRHRVHVQRTGVCWVVLGLDHGIQVRHEADDAVLREKSRTAAHDLEELRDITRVCGIRALGQRREQAVAPDVLVQDLC
jgi:hypothetical protein